MKEITQGDFMSIQEPLSIILSVVNGVSCILGSLGNLILILTILCHKQLRNGVSEMILVSLALVDFVSCAFYLPLLIIRVNTTDKLWTVMNQSRRAVGQATAVGASLNLLMLTADQYIFFYRPLRYYFTMKKRNVLIAISLIHIISLSSGVFAFHDMSKSQYFKNAVISLAICAFFVLHYAIWRLVSRQRDKLANQRLSLQYNYHVTAHAKQNLNTVILFGVLYVITWLPVTIFQIWHTTTYNDNLIIFQTYFYPLVTVQHINSLVDPFLYCYRNHKIRSVFRKFFNKRHCIGHINTPTDKTQNSCCRNSKALLPSENNPNARPVTVCEVIQNFPA